MLDPTHHGHKLDRIYTTSDIYSTAKVVKSTVKTAHMAIIARAEAGHIVDLNKSSTVVEYRKHTPVRNSSFLSALQIADWTDIYLLIDTQTALIHFMHACL